MERTLWRSLAAEISSTCWRFQFVRAYTGLSEVLALKIRSAVLLGTCLCCSARWSFRCTTAYGGDDPWVLPSPASACSIPSMSSPTPLRLTPSSECTNDTPPTPSTPDMKTAEKTFEGWVRRRCVLASLRLSFNSAVLSGANCLWLVSGRLRKNCSLKK